jgi:hypothetical protein
VINVGLLGEPLSALMDVPARGGVSSFENEQPFLHHLPKNYVFIEGF